MVCFGSTVLLFLYLISHFFTHCQAGHIKDALSTLKGKNIHDDCVPASRLEECINQRDSCRAHQKRLFTYNSQLEIQLAELKHTLEAKDEEIRQLRAEFRDRLDRCEVRINQYQYENARMHAHQPAQSAQYQDIIFHEQELQSPRARQQAAGPSTDPYAQHYAYQQHQRHGAQQPNVPLRPSPLTVGAQQMQPQENMQGQQSRPLRNQPLAPQPISSESAAFQRFLRTNKSLNDIRHRMRQGQGGFI